MRLFLKAVVAVGIVVFLIAVISLLTKLPNETQLPAATEQSQQPTFTVTAGDPTYHGAISSNVGVAVLGINSGPYFMGFGSLVRADGKFIIVSVAIRNGQNTAITMDTNLFEIMDSSGNVYSASEKSMEVEPGSDLFLAKINPGVTKTGRIVFDVPANLNMDNLRLRFRGGMTGDSADLPLVVNATDMRAPAQPEPTTPTGEYSSPPEQPSSDAQPVRPQTEESPNQGASSDVAAPKPSLTPQPTQVLIRTDGQIEMDVMHALNTSNALKSSIISVATTQGEVTLSGTVPNDPSRELAESLAGYVRGVIKVHNNLKVGNPQGAAQ